MRSSASINFSLKEKAIVEHKTIVLEDGTIYFEDGTVHDPRRLEQSMLKTISRSYQAQIQFIPIAMTANYDEILAAMVKLDDYFNRGSKMPSLEDSNNVFSALFSNPNLSTKQKNYFAYHQTYKYQKYLDELLHEPTLIHFKNPEYSQILLEIYKLDTKQIEWDTHIKIWKILLANKNHTVDLLKTVGYLSSRHRVQFYAVWLNTLNTVTEILDVANTVNNCFALGFLALSLELMQQVEALRVDVNGMIKQRLLSLKEASLQQDAQHLDAEISAHRNQLVKYLGTPRTTNYWYHIVPTPSLSIFKSLEKNESNAFAKSHERAAQLENKVNEDLEKREGPSSNCRVRL